MASRDFAASTQNPDFSVRFFYDPTLKQVHSSQCVLDEKSILLAGNIRRKDLTATYQVDPAATKINKEAYVLPPSELVHMVKAITARDRQGSVHKLAIREIDLGGREYYVSLAAGTSTETILTNENVHEAIRRIKQRESIAGLSGAAQTLVTQSAPDGPVGP